MFKSKLTQEEFVIHCNNWDGFCESCCKWTVGGVRPVTIPTKTIWVERYECKNCGAFAVIGGVQATIQELLDIGYP